MKIEIEKNVPIPSSARPGRPNKYPFSKMEVGDSFFCLEKYVRVSAFQYGKRNNVKFASCKEGEGFRVWRIA